MTNHKFWTHLFYTIVISQSSWFYDCSWAAIVKRTASIKYRTCYSGTILLYGSLVTLCISSHFICPNLTFPLFSSHFICPVEFCCFFLKWILSGKRHVFKGFSGSVNSNLTFFFAINPHHLFIVNIEKICLSFKNHFSLTFRLELFVYFIGLFLLWPIHLNQSRLDDYRSYSRNCFGVNIVSGDALNPFQNWMHKFVWCFSILAAKRKTKR